MDYDETVKHIGAGTGNLTTVAAKSGYNTIGIEPNSKMRDIATEKYPSISL